MYGQESAKRQIAELAKGGAVRETEALSCAVRRQPEEKSFLFDNPVDIYIYIYIQIMGRGVVLTSLHHA